ncbi:MAG: hypothetical protein V7638_673 [Acidobacteriota bacterium]|jgi:hypothetical protein
MTELDDQADAELVDLVRQIFEIIPSYYDEREAAEIRSLVKGYVETRLEKAESDSS